MADEGRAAFITGGTGALGRAVVAKFLWDGWRVAVTSRRAGEWDDLARRHDAAIREACLTCHRVELSDEEATRDAIGRAAADFGGLAALVHLAGGYAGGAHVEAVDARTVRAMIDSNLVSAFWAAKHAIPHLRRSGQGRLLFISSRGAVETYPGAAAYAAAKAGLQALVLTLAKELKSQGVTANAVLPSIIDTPANRAAMPDADHGAWVDPGAVASLLAYLASAAAGSVSGALIPIHGRA
jgi:NAD(P)-dependent dehydrogenase (short-subunit alcohol dehydrogenase family)